LRVPVWIIESFDICQTGTSTATTNQSNTFINGGSYSFLKRRPIDILKDPLLSSKRDASRILCSIAVAMDAFLRLRRAAGGTMLRIAF
jgi:hypothetical protein